MRCAGLFTGINVLLVILGLGCLGVGIWMNAEKDVKAYLVVFGAHPDGNWLVASTCIFLACGAILIGIAVLGFLGAKHQHLLMLQFYCILILIVMIMMLIVGFLIVAFRNLLYNFTLNNMRNQLAEDYSWTNRIGKAWNRVQVREKCCGAESAEDYRCGEWWYAQEGNEGFGCPDNYYDAHKHVPRSCCVLIFNEDRDPEEVDPQNPNPKNELRCNQDSAGNMWAGSSNVHHRGCFSKLQDFIFTHIYILMAMGLGIGFLLVVCMAIGCTVLRSIKGREDI